MSAHIPAVATAFIPLTSFLSLSIYLSTHPKSPARRLRRVALPTHQDEPLDARKDPFEIGDDGDLGDGHPVNPDQFWRSMKQRKRWLLASLILPFVANIALLVLTVSSNAVIPPAMLLSSHIVTIIMALAYLSHADTASHWATTIHLWAALFVQFMVLAVIALLPNEPFLMSHASVNIDNTSLLRSALPILHLLPLIIVLFIRRGPPLYVPLDHIYPPKIAEAIPSDHPSLDPKQSNVCEEVQATIPEWLLFGYVTNVVKKGYKADTMDVWDLPVLTHNMRKCSHGPANVRGARLLSHLQKRIR